MTENITQTRRQKNTSSNQRQQPIQYYKGNQELSINEWGLTLDLYSHQKNSIQRMEYLEMNRKREYTTDNSTILIESNFGLLNDKVGSGKSLMCVSVISREVNSPNFNKESREQDYIETIQMHGNSIFSVLKKSIKKILYIPITVIVFNNSIIYKCPKIKRII